MAIRVGTTSHNLGGIRVSTNAFSPMTGYAENLSMDSVETGQDIVYIRVVPPDESQLYEIQWRDVATQTLAGEASGFTDTTYLMENLVPNTYYEWRVRTLAGDFTEWVQFQTEEAVDGIISVYVEDYTFVAPTATAVGVKNYPELTMTLDAQETGNDRFEAEMELLMVATWPETLPQKLLVDGYSQAAANTLMRSNMETGPAKQRRRFSSGVEPVSGKLILDYTEFDTLKEFYDTTLIGGSLRFIWKDPTDQLSGNRLFRFTSPINWTTYGAGLFNVSLQLEMLPN